MPGTFRYALDRFTWDGSFMGGLGSHVPPTGAVSVLDLRPDSECSKRVQSGGYGLFAWPAGATLPGSAIPLGDGYIAEIVISGTVRNNIKTALGMATPPSGNTLADVFLDGVLGDNADPTGTTGPRPIDFTTTLDRELWLANHSRVAFRTYDPAQMFAANPKGVHSHLRDLMRDQVRKADAINPTLGEKVLGAMLMKCGVARDEVKNGAPNRKGDAQKLMPPEWSNGKKNGTQVREPKTQLVETWPTNGAITSGQTYTWANALGTGTVSGGYIQSNAGASQMFARCTSAVSSADHWTDAAVSNTTFFHAGAACRFSSSALTCYWAVWYWSNSNDYLIKHVAGAQTVVGTLAHAGASAVGTTRCRANGSTISMDWDGANKITATDTAIAGNLFGGVQVYPDTGQQTSVKVGQVTIDDGLSAAAGGGGVGSAMLLDML